MKYGRMLSLLATTAMVAVATPALAAEPSLQEEVVLLKAQIAAQNQQLAAQAARLEQVEARLQVAAAPPAQPMTTAEGSSGVTAASASVPSFAVNSASGGGADTTIGGYGEISYNARTFAAKHAIKLVGGTELAQLLPAEGRSKKGP